MRWTRSSSRRQSTSATQQKSILGRLLVELRRRHRRLRPSGTFVLGTSWQIIVNLGAGRQGAGRGRAAQGGLDRMGGHLDDRRQAKHPNCAYQWINWIT